MMKSRKTTDRLLATLFLLAAITGAMLHVATERPAAGHNAELWSWLHAVTAFAFAIFIFIHARQHWPWYKALQRKAATPKARNRRLGVAVLDALYALLLATGLCLLACECAWLGRAHWVLGVIAVLWSVWHIAKRIKMM